jgi:hypothetical protein
MEAANNLDETVAARFSGEAIGQRQDELTVCVRCLSTNETRRCFGASTARAGAQVVWIQIQNDGDTSVRYAPILTDPNYFAPQEVAQQLHGWFSGARDAHMDAALVRGAMPNFIPAHAVVSGFVYTHADGGLKFVNVGCSLPASHGAFASS